MLVLALVLSLGARVGVLGPAENVVLRVTAPAETGLTELFRPVALFLGNVREVNDLREDNRQLRVDNESLRNQVTSLLADTEELKQLRQALEITDSDAGDCGCELPPTSSAKTGQPSPTLSASTAGPIPASASATSSFQRKAPWWER